MDEIISHGALAVMWLGYFALHSLLASNAFKAFVAKVSPRLFLRYRLVYNASAVLLLVPVVWLMKWIDSSSIWQWPGPLQWLANGLAIIAVGIFLWSTRFYDMSSFLGLAKSDPAIPPRFVLSPLHRFVRHPWYFLALLIIWTRDMDSAFLVSAVLMTGYFWWGSKLEENKLIAEFGSTYIEYIRKVPGLVPWPGRFLTREQCKSLVDGRGSHTYT